MPARRAFLLVLVGLLLPSLAAEAAEGETLGIAPGEIRVEAAQPGETYLRAITLQNRFATATRVAFEPGGAVAPWISLPAEGVLVPARTTTIVQAAIRVPADVGGSWNGQIRVVGEPGEGPEGSGLAFRHAAIVRVALAVGGAATQSARLDEASAEDVEQGSPPVASAKVTNDGNVRSRVKIRAEILDFHTGQVLGEVEFEVELLPGETRDAPLPFTETLPSGQYRLRTVTTSGAATSEEIREFKVYAPGTLPKRGEIRALLHEPSSATGLPLRLTVVFENVGSTTIARAEVVGDVRRAETLVATLAGAGLLVLPGAEANLSAVFTPSAAGTHVVEVKVVYDGYETPVARSLVAVTGGPPALDVPWPLVGALAAAGFFFLFAWRRRKRRKDEE